MKKLWVFLAFFLLVQARLFTAGDNPWGQLKKITVFDAIGDFEQVKASLNRISGETLSQEEKGNLIQQLTHLGHNFYSRQKFDLAEACHRQVLAISPGSWQVYNELEKIRKSQGGFFVSFFLAWRQFVLALKDFNVSFVLLSAFLNALLFSGLLVFFVFGLLILWKYLSLAVNDFLMAKGIRMAVGGVVIRGLVLCWPVFFLAGWAIYPYLILGFLWVYLDDSEKKIAVWLQVVLVIFSCGQALNRYLEKSIRNPGFQLQQEVATGTLYPEKVYRDFDDELKVIQAYAYYDRHESDQALTILKSVKPQYRSALKFNLLGSIYVELDQISRSIQYFREALNLSDKDQVALNNFAIALLKNRDLKVFESYAVRYRELNQYLKKNAELLKVKTDRGFLWRRALYFGRPEFEPGHFLSKILLEMIQSPVLIYIAILLIYFLLGKKLFSFLGGSAYCSKCAKLIRKKSIEHTHQLCEECYQLFLLKDPIFLEAKNIKEREIRKKNRLEYLMVLFFSLFMPGFYLNYFGKTRYFVTLSGIFFFLVVFFLTVSFSLSSIYGMVPVFLGYLMLAAMALYVLTNFFILGGEKDGI